MLKGFRALKPGQVYTVEDGAANIWIHGGRAVEVDGNDRPLGVKQSNMVPPKRVDVVTKPRKRKGSKRKVSTA